MEALPYLTADLPGIGGRIKERCEDFRVEEIPLYEPSGEGTHIYFRIVKAGIPTPTAVERIARYMGVRANDIGVAGLKDAQAITTQMLSIEHADPAKLAKYRDSQLSVVWTGRHGNKLRPGLLAGNRFAVRIRGVGRGEMPRAAAIVNVLSRRGVANFFGEQRFGSRGDTDQLGKALVKNNIEEFIAMYLGRSRSEDPPDCRAARDAFDSGYMDRALQCWPRHYVNERRALAAYKKKRRAGSALAAIDKRMKRLYVSAFQGAIFNAVLSRRLATLDRVLAGDLAQKTDTNGVFLVEDPALEQPRADAFEISPTGPIVGYRSTIASGEPGQIEQEAIAAAGVKQEDFRHVGTLSSKGSRRPLRFPLGEPKLQPGSDPHGPFIEATFSAPSGCYATVVLREIMKTPEE